MKLFETKKSEVNLFFSSSGYDCYHYCFTLIPTIVVEIDNSFCGWKEFKLEWLCFTISIMIQEID
jgi:hypothetical protein